MGKTIMTDEQRLFFETNGYLVIPDALSPEELARAREAADRAEAAWRADPTRLGVRRENLQQVQAPIEYDDYFLDLMEHPKVFPLVREILGNDVSMIDNDLYISPPHTSTHARWHHDVGMPGVYHPRSVLMVKVFYLLEDVPPGGGGTLFLPGSHRFPMDFPLPNVENPPDMPGHVEMAFPAGTAYFFNGRCFHAASDNTSDKPRRVLIYNYGHHWMRIWPGYEPSQRLLASAQTAVRKQLLGMGPAYMTGLKDDE
ncbi:MAG TPA: phytanoyl-CoA dioxygenase family protein [Chthonomonadaceae bacterium]|nr:phytanoyl-CoA dioxygenase family protein [Chthonomonadaceae bacterium]